MRRITCSTAAREPTATAAAADRQVLIMSAVPGLRDGAVSVGADNRLSGFEVNGRRRFGGALGGGEPRGARACAPARTGNPATALGFRAW